MGVVLFCFLSNLHPFNFSSTLLVTATITRRRECSLVTLGGLPPPPWVRHQLLSCRCCLWGCRSPFPVQLYWTETSFHLWVLGLLCTCLCPPLWSFALLAAANWCTRLIYVAHTLGHTLTHGFLSDWLQSCKHFFSSTLQILIFAFQFHLPSSFKKNLTYLFWFF